MSISNSIDSIGRAPERDEALLDGYSRTVTAVAAAVSPSVVRVDVEGVKTPPRSGRPRGPNESIGSGSGFVFTPEEKKTVAANVYAHVWQQAMSGQFASVIRNRPICIRISPSALRSCSEASDALSGFLVASGFSEPWRR